MAVERETRWPVGQIRWPRVNGPVLKACLRGHNNDCCSCRFAARKRSCEKVIFLHLSVSPSVHRGSVSLYDATSCLTETPWTETPPPNRDPPPPYSKEHAVRIRLECILVFTFKSTYQFSFPIRLLMVPVGEARGSLGDRLFVPVDGARSSLGDP